MAKADGRMPAPAPTCAADRISGRGSRAAAQRERILAAAQKCFIERGFHAASMATISSKDAIVLAIIERQLKESRIKIAELRASTDIAANLRRSFEEWQRGESQNMNVALFLAMSADASHDPQVAQALRASDRLVRADLTAWLGRSREDGGRELHGDVAGSRAVLIQCIVEGLAIRALREPDLDIDKLGPALDRLFDQLLAP